MGYQPELKIRLEVTDSDYAFKGTYRSSNVTVKGAEFVSASKSSGDLVIKAKLKPIKGTFEAPEDAYWKDNAKGTAKWEEPDNGGTSDEVELRKGSSKIHTVETTGKTYQLLSVHDAGRHLYSSACAPSPRHPNRMITARAVSG
ncbi:MAG: hypothetical protein V8S58_00515 [Lachnospiraceae bacterium]